MKTPNPDHPIRNTLKHLALAVAVTAAFLGARPSGDAPELHRHSHHREFRWFGHNRHRASRCSPAGMPGILAQPPAGDDRWQWFDHRDRSAGGGRRELRSPVAAPILANLGTTSAPDRALGSFARTTPAATSSSSWPSRTTPGARSRHSTLSYTGEEWRSSATRPFNSSPCGTAIPTRSTAS